MKGFSRFCPISSLEKIQIERTQEENDKYRRAIASYQSAILKNRRHHQQIFGNQVTLFSLTLMFASMNQYASQILHAALLTERETLISECIILDCAITSKHIFILTCKDGQL